MAKIYYDHDVDLDEIKKLTLGVIGYGNQGRAHALNLKDSGLSVFVGSREGGRSRAQAVQDGFAAMSDSEVAQACDLLALTLPDEAIPQVFTEAVEPHLASTRSTPRTLLFAHGFAVHHKTIKIPSNVDVVLVAPTGPGRQLRSLFERGKGLPSLIAVDQDASGSAFRTALAYAKGIGSARAGVIETTFREETIVDLYCEQTVLCGGIPELIKSSFETLVKAGYQPELAYISCLKEVKLISDLLFDVGIDGMRSAISTTARFGSAISGPEIIDERTSDQLTRILRRIESGEFASLFLKESREGLPSLEDFVMQERDSRLARTGKELRELIDF